MTFDEREELMGIMDNEGHDPMGFGNVRSALPMQADPDPRAALKEARAKIARLRAQVEDAELALNVWDAQHDSEYWLRYPRDPGDLISSAL